MIPLFVVKCIELALIKYHPQKYLTIKKGSLFNQFILLTYLNIFKLNVINTAKNNI